MEDGARSQFVVEVNQLSHRLAVLKQSIVNIQESVNKQMVKSEENRAAIAATDSVISQSETALMLTPSQKDWSLQTPDQAEEQISSLRNQLISLSSVESRLTSCTGEIRDVSVPLVTDDTSSSELTRAMNQWQSVFEESLGQYHSLLAHIAQHQDRLTALRVWEDNMNTASSNLSTQLSESYHEISQQIGLGLLHRTLLINNQQHLLLRNISDDHITNLTKRNQEILDQIDNRNLVLSNRQMLWNKVTVDHQRLAAWIRDMEREKQLLNLKHVSLHLIMSLLVKIEKMLEKVPQGERLLQQLLILQPELSSQFSPSVLTSLRSEFHNYQVNQNSRFYEKYFKQNFF